MESPDRVVGVWGMGREGVSVSNLLASEGNRVIAIDEHLLSRPDNLTSSVEFVPGAGLERFLECDLVVASPGIPRVHPYRHVLESHRVKTTTATNLWMRTRTHDIVGVTGTKGKSTTSALINFLLNSAGIRSELGGNIGIPLTDISDPDAVVVAELSSYHCAYLEHSPRVAVVTSLFQDHLPWHGSLRQYWLDKARIFTEGAEVLICSRVTRDTLLTLGVDLPAKIRTSDAAALDHMQARLLPEALSAPHNVENLKLALLAVEEVSGFAVDLDSLYKSLPRFQALPHRLEVISRRDGRIWVDDSLSTTPESVVAAIESFVDRDLVLIVGGMDRGIDYSLLAAALFDRTPRIQVVCLPDHGLEMVASYQQAHASLVHSVQNMREAVEVARRVSGADSLIVLSPGAPSQNVYRNFEDKSLDFLSAVNDLPGSESGEPRTH